MAEGMPASAEYPSAAAALSGTGTTTSASTDARAPVIDLTSLAILAGTSEDDGISNENIHARKRNAPGRARSIALARVIPWARRSPFRRVQHHFKYGVDQVKGAGFGCEDVAGASADISI